MKYGEPIIVGFGEREYHPMRHCPLCGEGDLLNEPVTLALINPETLETAEVCARCASSNIPESEWHPSVEGIEDEY